jgi:hypothetical protein
MFGRSTRMLNGIFQTWSAARDQDADKATLVNDFNCVRRMFACLDALGPTAFDGRKPLWCNYAMRAKGNCRDE